jgi:hypothetical protein
MVGGLSVTGRANSGDECRQNDHEIVKRFQDGSRDTLSLLQVARNNQISP